MLCGGCSRACATITTYPHGMNSMILMLEEFALPTSLPSKPALLPDYIDYLLYVITSLPTFHARLGPGTVSKPSRVRLR